MRPVLMIVHAYYEEDPRVRREAESLARAGGLPRSGCADRSCPPRKSCRASRAAARGPAPPGAGLGRTSASLSFLLVRSGWAAVKLHRRHRFGLVQVHSLPDFLVFAALPLRLVGVPVLLDLHEAMPEFFVTRFPARPTRCPTGCCSSRSALDDVCDPRASR